MSKTVVPTPSQKVVLADENHEILEKIVLSEMIWAENTIMGNVSDKHTGKTLEGVCIKVCDEKYNPIAYNFSDVDGNFSIEGSFSPTIRVIAAKKGYETISSDALLSESLNKKALNLELLPAPGYGLIIFGSVKDTQQKPIYGAKVTAYRNQSLNPYDFTFTNQEGLYIFDNIEPGAYRISIQSQSYNERLLNIEINKEMPIITLETVYLKKKILKGTIHGIITDKNQVPLSNALVVLCNGNNMPIQATYTNEDGIYLFYKLDPGTYTVIAK
ncbi:MAG: MSCRAMM family protein [Acetivibrionales bacterium]